MEQGHGLALPAAIVQRQDRHTRSRMLPIEGHEGRRGGYIITISLVTTDTYLPYTGLRLGYNGCGILVFGCLETPGHDSALIPLIPLMIPSLNPRSFDSNDPMQCEALADVVVQSVGC